MENLTYMAKNSTKMCHFQAKNLKNFLGRGHRPLPRPYPHWEGNTPDQTTRLGIYLCTYFCFFGGALHV